MNGLLGIILLGCVPHARAVPFRSHALSYNEAVEYLNHTGVKGYYREHLLRDAQMAAGQQAWHMYITSCVPFQQIEHNLLILLGTDDKTIANDPMLHAQYIHGDHAIPLTAGREIMKYMMQFINFFAGKKDHEATMS